MKKILFSFLAIFLLTFGCMQEILIPEFEAGEDGISTIFSFGVLAPTDDHLNGGWSFNVGYDVNKNVELDEEEILASAPLWHGNDGLNGTDGKDGLNGVDGVDGVDGIGIDGVDGIDGIDGQTPNLYLVNLDLPATEGHDNGGILVTTVWDKNNDQLIDENEIVGMYTVWHGNNGYNGIDGKSPYVLNGYWFYWSSETNTYVNGGKAQGADGQDGSDGSNGVDGKSPYVLNGYWYFWNSETNVWINGGKSTGVDGADGAKGDQGDRGTIVGYIITSAENCETNGYRITMTIDEGLNTEYEQWFEVCDGRVGDTGAVGPRGPRGYSGFNSLMVITPKIEGCITIYSGLDLNGNNVLDIDEVIELQTRILCDGVDGSDGVNGADGHSSLIELIEDDNCVIIKAWLDLNDNLEIDAGDELLGTETVCSCSLDDCDDEGCGEENDKVAICHKYTVAGFPLQFTLYVPQSSVQAHINHGDSEGSCNNGI